MSSRSALPLDASLPESIQTHGEESSDRLLTELHPCAAAAYSVLSSIALRLRQGRTSDELRLTTASASRVDEASWREQPEE
jgi:hypothetical protein